MRFAPTRAEEWLWRRLSGSKTGFAFRRQLVIGEYIVDFACTKVRLVVEVDGSDHEQRARHDAARDRALGEMGWRVLRVPEHHVFGDLEGVVLRITDTAWRCRPCADALAVHLPSLSPTGWLSASPRARRAGGPCILAIKAVGRPLPI
jgi:very-short-patch-repair endonuclease